MSIDDNPIDLQMMTLLEHIWSDRIGFQSALDRKCVGDRVKLTYYRPGETETRECHMKLESSQNAYRKLHADADSIRYAVLAGVVVMPLAVNHVEALRENGKAFTTMVTRPDVRLSQFS